jgi:hypothetical protein
MRKGKELDPLTNRSGYGRPKNLRIRFRTTACKSLTKRADSGSVIQLCGSGSVSKHHGIGTLPGTTLKNSPEDYLLNGRVPVPSFYDISRRLNLKFPNNTNRKDSFHNFFGTKDSFWAVNAYKVRTFFVNENKKGFRVCGFSVS